MQRSQQKSEALQNNDLTVADISGRYKRAIDRRSRWLSLWRFSCWNVNDPNRVKIVIVSIRSRTFQACLRVARRAMAGTLIDTTSGATHYHHKAINPPWARGRAAIAEIGPHLFYNNIE